MSVFYNRVKKGIRACLPRDWVGQLDYWRYGKHNHAGQRDPNIPWSLAAMLNRKIIFVHIPKTGGMSVSQVLYGEAIPRHASVAQMKEAIGPYRFRKYFSFAFVRNPYSRLVSVYTFIKKGGFSGVPSPWAQEMLDQCPTFSSFVMDWLNVERMSFKVVFRPQTYFVCEPHQPHTPAVDFIGRFEMIEQDWRHVANLTGSNDVLPQNNVSGRGRPWQEFYTESARQKVASLYADDFDVFGYSPDLLGD